MRGWTWIVVVVAGCGKGGDAGSGSGSRSTVATTSAAVGDCKPIKLCERFPPVHVDPMCGTTSSKAMPRDTDNPQLLTDECHYENNNGNSTISIGRICLPGDGGTDKAKQMFKMGHDEHNKSETTVDLPGLGDEAMYRGHDHRNGVLVVRTGNTLVTVENSYLTPETEEALKTKCLVAIYNELK